MKTTRNNSTLKKAKNKLATSQKLTKSSPRLKIIPECNGTLKISFQASKPQMLTKVNLKSKIQQIHDLRSQTLKRLKIWSRQLSQLLFRIPRFMESMRFHSDTRDYKRPSKSHILNNLAIRKYKLIKFLTFNSIFNTNFSNPIIKDSGSITKGAKRSIHETFQKWQIRSFSIMSLMYLAFWGLLATHQ